jgi:hypothetical protein
MSPVPKAFVWTKIQADAGQTVWQILYRKELERLAGGGTFWWGIGESKAKAISLLVKNESRPALLFSLMLSRPHARDSTPDGVVLWQAYETCNGNQPLPPHVVVTSRALASNGSPKRRHYAIVCESHLSILSNGGGKLDAGCLRNVGDGGRSVGASQVTAVVEQRGARGNDARYEITARATVVTPFAVTLSLPRELLPAERQLLDEVGNEGKGRDDWFSVARKLRRGAPT